MEVPFHYDPRDYQAEFLQGMRNARIGVLKWSRRAGKGLSTFAYAITRMVEEPMGVVIIYPSKEQGFNSFWNNVENDGFRTIEHVPKELIESQTNSADNMTMRLKNGSTLTLLGANASPEALRGQNTKLYILSEFVDIMPGVLGIIRPVIAANDGQIILESTVKQDGIQGATFLRLFSAAEKDPTQYASKVTADRYMTAEMLEQVRQDYIDEYGNDFLYRQEFLLDEGQALATSYYGNPLNQMKKQGRIGLHGYNSDYPVFTSWDLGMADSTAIWWWQYYDKGLHIIDFHETHDIDDEATIKFVLSKPYNQAWHFWPHDGAKRDSDNISRITKAQTLYGLVNSSLLTRTSDREQGIRKVVELFNEPTTTIHEPTCKDGVAKLKLYKRKWNPITGDYEGPEHKTASHAADGMRYCAEAIQEAFDEETGDFYYEESEEATTDSEEMVMALAGYDSWPEYEDDEGSDW